MNILLLGSGGRESAFAWKLSQSEECESLFIAPGNAGTSAYGTNVSMSATDFEAIKTFCIENDINMVVVGPEDPLVMGIVDFFAEDEEIEHIAVIGPSKEGAQLEGSKDYSKRFMQRHNIPTAAYETFTKEELEKGLAYLENHTLPIVLKADGLAAGKGVLICETREEAKEELRLMLAEAKFGEASQQVVIEEFLSGIELSVFVLNDNFHYLILPEAKDYKRIGEGDTGLNTGGMGSISPVPFADATFMQKVEERIIIPTVEGLATEEIDYKGFIFIGLMNVNGEPFVIEYNVRMGDPETESVLPRIENDLVDLFIAVAEGRLSEKKINIDPRHAATVMLVAGGYPGDYKKGDVISALDNIKYTHIFHAGTKMENGNVATNGGRVIAVTSLDIDKHEALRRSNEYAAQIQYEGKYFRKDIGKDLLFQQQYL
jgi:phosphoribosylamine--glycine ligase